LGTRYFLTVSCLQCGRTNNDIYYAPTCGFLTHKCDHCGVEFDIEAQLCERERTELRRQQEEHSAMIERMVEGFGRSGAVIDLEDFT